MSAVRRLVPESDRETVVIGRGEFGGGAAAALRAAIDSMSPASELTVDLSEVTFLDQRGIGALLGAAHRLAEGGSTMTITGVTPDVRTVLRSVGLHRLAALP
jgi:anti-anti-sigma factor